WWTRAACTGMSLDEFFSDSPSNGARDACESCPVVLDCLADEIGVPMDEIYGFRAALGAAMRRRVLSAAAALRPAPRMARIRWAFSAMATGASVTEVAAAVGVSRRTIQRWVSA